MLQISYALHMEILFSTFGKSLTNTFSAPALKSYKIYKMKRLL
jgi:hypothetical protein